SGAAIERVQRPLEKSDCNRWPHVDAGIEQLGGETRRAIANAVEARTLPIDAAIDGGGSVATEQSHVAAIAIATRGRAGDPPAGGAAWIIGMVDIAALAVNDGVDQVG